MSDSHSANVDHNAVTVAVARALDCSTATWEQIEEITDACLTYVENHHGLCCPGQMCPCSYRGKNAERELIAHYLSSHTAKPYHAVWGKDVDACTCRPVPRGLTINPGCPSHGDES